MSDLAKMAGEYERCEMDREGVADYVEALEARVADLEALRAALVRDNRDKTNALREALAHVAELEAAIRRFIRANRAESHDGQAWEREWEDALCALEDAGHVAAAEGKP